MVAHHKSKPSVFQRIRELNVDVCLLIYSLLIFPCDFSLPRKAMFKNYPREEAIAELVCLAGGLFVIFAAWTRNWRALTGAFAYTMFTLSFFTMFSITFPGTRLIPEEMRRLLKHNTAEAITEWQRIGYWIYFALNSIQIFLSAVIQLILIHKTYSSPNSEPMLQKLQKIDVRVWFAIWSIWGCSAGIGLLKMLHSHGFDLQMIICLVIALLGLVTVYAAFTNQKGALKFTKKNTTLYLLICGAAFIICPVYIYHQLDHLDIHPYIHPYIHPDIYLDIHPDVHSEIFLKLVLLAIIFELVVAFLMCICGLQLALVTSVIKKIDSEIKKVDVEMQNIV